MDFGKIMIEIGKESPSPWSDPIKRRNQKHLVLIQDSNSHLQSLLKTHIIQEPETAGRTDELEPGQSEQIHFPRFTESE